MVEVESRPETFIKVFGTAPRTGPVPLSTPFSVEIVNAPCYEKVKMPTVDLYDGTNDPEEHLGLYKAQKYVLRFFPATPKRGVAVLIQRLGTGKRQVFPRPS